MFFQHVNPDIAGRFRKTGEGIKKLKCTEPPPGSAVMEEMYAFWRELDNRISRVPPRPNPKSPRALRKALEEWNGRVLDLAAWVQYEIALIHPFCEGNGRMARLMTNLILHRFTLPPTDIKYEGENRAAYIDALCKIDHEGDFRPLRQLIVRGMIASSQKVLEAKQRAARKAKVK